MTSRGIAEIPVVILCGGLGMYLDGSEDRTAKPLIDINGKPMVSRVVDIYSKQGFKRFILAGGHQSDRLRKLQFENVFGGADIEVLDTGLGSTTAQRLAKVRSSLGSAEDFGLTYSDTLSDVSPSSVFEFHLKHQRTATVVAAHLPTRFKVLGIPEGDISVKGFSTKPIIQKDFINGGFYFFRKDVFELPAFQHNREITLEEDVLGGLVSQGQLAAYRHEGLWQHLDSERDIGVLRRLFKD